MWFQKFACYVAEKTGTWWAFLLSLAIFLFWLATGHFYEWSEEHHRWFDVLISVTPFLMVFVLQATQNRDADIVEAKLDELLKAVKNAREDLVEIQNDPGKDIDACKQGGSND